MTTIADRIAHLSDRFEQVISNVPAGCLVEPVAVCGVDRHATSSATSSTCTR